MSEFSVFRNVQNHMANEAKQMPPRPPRKSNTKVDWGDFLTGLLSGMAVMAITLAFMGVLK